MPRPSLEFLCSSIAEALLLQFGVTAAPVPIQRFFYDLPAEIARSLRRIPAEHVFWTRWLSYEGTVDGSQTDVQKRFVLACRLFVALCLCEGGRTAGMPFVMNSRLRRQALVGASYLLMPTSLLPDNWRVMPSLELADLFDVPVYVAEVRQHKRPVHPL